MNLFSELDERSKTIKLEEVKWPRQEILDPRRLLNIKASDDVKRAWGLVCQLEQDIVQLEREHQEFCPPEQCRGHCAGTCQSEYDRHLELLNVIKVVNAKLKLAHEVLMYTMLLELPTLKNDAPVGIDMNGDYYYHHRGPLDIKIIHVFI